MFKIYKYIKCRCIKLILCMVVDIGLKFYAEPSRPNRVTLRSRSWVIYFDRFSVKSQVRRATLSYAVPFYIYLFYFLFAVVNYLLLSFHVSLDLPRCVPVVRLY